MVGCNGDRALEVIQLTLHPHQLLPTVIRKVATVECKEETGVPYNVSMVPGGRQRANADKNGLQVYFTPFTNTHARKGSHAGTRIERKDAMS